MAINLDKVGVEFTIPPFDYGPQTVELYHLGIGATELQFTYEKELKVIPSFAVVPAFMVLVESVGLVGINPMMVVHGEQRIEILQRPIPWTGKTITTGKVVQIYDKGKGALIVVEGVTHDEGGNQLFRNIYRLFDRGEGGFGGERGPGPKNEPPNRRPDHMVELSTWPHQHLIYRLSGDINPLHVDPEFAKLVGYNRPILHGLCTFGFVCRAIMQACCDNDPTRILDYEARFSREVYPGEAIITEIWEETDQRVVIQAKTGDGRVVITNAAATLSR